MCCRAFVQSSVAPISASAMLRAVYDCLFDCQCMRPPSHMMKPAMDLDLKRSSSMGGSLGFGTEASWGPHFASKAGRSLLGSIRNWMKESSFWLFRLLK